MHPLGIYLHVPFCIRKCNYCDFLSFGCQSEEIKERYVTALCREIQQYGEVYGKRYYVDTAFIGGGTPSLLSGQQIAHILGTLFEAFPGKRDGKKHEDEQDVFSTEISMETNPGTVTPESLRAYRQAGINRLSIGVQSLDDALLWVLGRIHSAADAVRAVEMAREAGFTNMNLDLMFGFPGQKTENWEDTLKQVLSWKPEHLSFYSLELEENTSFGKAYKAGSLNLLDEAEDRRMYHRALELLKTNGYEHYEISNVAVPGRRCRHNLKYWNMEEYLGLGLGAFSYLRGDGMAWGERFWNKREMEAYLKAETLEAHLAGRQKNDRDEEMSDHIFTGLRKTEGISLTDFNHRYGVVFQDHYRVPLMHHLEEGLLVLTERDDGQWLRFSEDGLDHTNSVLAEYV